MKSLRSKGYDAEFDAGIQSRSLKNKTSRFFLRKNEKVDKPLPAPPSNTSTTSVASPTVTVFEEDDDQLTDETLQEHDASALERPLPFPPAPRDFPETAEPTTADGSTDAPKLKARRSFATLRSKSSLLFRTNNSSTTHLPPPPPIPQIPVDPPALKPRRPILVPSHPARDSRSFIASSHGRNISISRPILMPQLTSLPIPEHPVTVSFTKLAGPPPPRPPRPDTLDDEILAFMRESGTRMCIPSSNRGSASTVTCSTPRSYASSVEARLGLPSSYGTPPRYSIDSPLAACFPHDPPQPLPICDSAGSIKGYSRFSEYIKSQQGGYAIDGVDAEDRDTGPLEQHSVAKEGDWALEKRVSKGPNGNPGMLFRDRWGGFHFVADI